MHSLYIIALLYSIIFSVTSSAITIRTATKQICNVMKIVSETLKYIVYVLFRQYVNGSQLTYKMKLEALYTQSLASTYMVES